MNTKQLQLVTGKQAKRLDKLKFNWINKFAPIPWYDEKGVLHTDNFYPLGEYFTAPTVALALKWIRDEKRLIFSIGHVHLLEPHNSNKYYGVYEIPNNVLYTDEFSSYESAENALLDELLTILEKEKEQ